MQQKNSKMQKDLKPYKATIKAKEIAKKFPEAKIENNDPIFRAQKIDENDNVGLKNPKGLYYEIVCKEIEKVSPLFEDEAGISDPKSDFLLQDKEYYHGSDLSAFDNYQEIDQEKLPIWTDADLDKSKKLTVLKSACGTGKNYSLQLLIEEYLQQGKRIVIINPRRALSRTSSSYYGIDCYQDVEGDISGSGVICLDSITRIKTSSKNEVDLLILDEAAQLAQHSFGGTIRGQNNVDKIHEHMRYLSSCSKKIIAQDADMDSETTRHILTWTQHCDYQVICNLAKPFNPITILYPNMEQIWLMHTTIAERDGKTWATYTSAKLARTHAEEFKRIFPNKKVLCVHQGVMGEENIQECLDDPSKFSNYDAVFASPSIQTGISIEEKDTWHVFGYIQGLGENGPSLNDAHQGINRVRRPVNNKWHIFTSGKVNESTESIKEIIEDHRYANKETERFLKGICAYPVLNEKKETEMRLSNEALFLRAADLKVRENRYGGKYNDSFDDMGHFIPGAFRRFWMEKGFRIVNQSEFDHNMIYDFSEIKKQLDEQDMQDIIKAEIITKEEAEEESKKNLTRETKAKIELAKIRDFYDIKGDDKPSEEHIKAYMHNGRGKLMQFAEYLAFITNFEKRLASLDARKIHCDIHSRHICIKAELLQKFFKIIGIDIFSLVQRIDNGEDIKLLQQELMEQPIKIEGLKEQYDEYKKIFGMRITGGKEMNVIRSLLGRLNLGLIKGSQKNKKYQYYFDIAKLEKNLQLAESYYNKIINGDLEVRATFKKNKVDHDLEALIDSLPKSTTQYQDFEDDDPERDIELYNKHVLEHKWAEEPEFIYDPDENNSEFFMN